MSLKDDVANARRSLSRLASVPGASPHFVISPSETPEATAAEAPAELGPRELIILAAVYGNIFLRFDRTEWDVVPTVLEAGAFSESVARINARPGNRAGNIPLLWEHDQLIGRTLEVTDQPVGVRARARVTDEPSALQRLAYMKDGSATGASIGFMITDSRKVTVDGEEVEHVLRGELLEITGCLFGANPLAGIEQAASYVPQIAAGKVLRKELKARADCAAGDLAHILQAASKAAEEDEDGEEQVSRRWLMRELERLNLRIDTLAAELGRKE